ncbi:FAD-dependent oxidoreductase, partial [Mycobacterium sp. ITM-2017-0098]
TGVTVFDQTSFSKYLLVGRDAESSLQWLCTADVGVEVGRSVYTGMLNARGTYESDVTVTRTATDEYLIVSSAATTERDKDHIRRNLPQGADAHLVDVTSSYAVFGVMGPRSRDLLSVLTDADLSDDAFPFGTSRPITLGYASVRATRITYVGELGWELYVPAEFAVGVYEDLLAAGQRYGIARGGYYAIESLRLEKGYRAFGRELTPSENPVEAGLLFACKLKTDIAFLGRDAVEKARVEGVRKKLVGFVVNSPEVDIPEADSPEVDSPEPMLWGGELILRDGAVAGQATSAAWGATAGAGVGLAYLRAADGSVVDADWVRGGSYQVNVGGQLYPITVSLRPLYDPASERVRG